MYPKKSKRERKDPSWFLGHGFHPVPPTEYINFKILYAHEEDLRFVNQYGQEQEPDFNPAKRDPHKNHGHGVPSMRQFGNRKCHILRALAFFGPRPTFITKKGTVRPCECHHLNGDLTDHRKANILAWLPRSVHDIANARQATLRTVVPNGDLRGFDYSVLRELQDPRTMTNADFESRMEYLRFMKECDFDPRIFTAAAFHHFFSMPFEDFKTFFAKYKDPA